MEYRGFRDSSEALWQEWEEKRAKKGAAIEARKDTYIVLSDHSLNLKLRGSDASRIEIKTCIRRHENGAEEWTKSGLSLPSTLDSRSSEALIAFLLASNSEAFQKCGKLMIDGHSMVSVEKMRTLPNHYFEHAVMRITFDSRVHFAESVCIEGIAPEKAKTDERELMQKMDFIGGYNKYLVHVSPG